MRCVYFLANLRLETVHKFAPANPKNFNKNALNIDFIWGRTKQGHADKCMTLQPINSQQIMARGRAGDIAG